MKNILLLCSFIVVTYLHAQEFKLGKVSIEELSEKSHPLDKDADAAILFKEGVTNFTIVGDDWFIVTEIKVRVKIYTKAGYAYAQEELPYYVKSSVKENVFFSDAATYNLVDGKIEKTKLKSDGEFEREINDSWRAKKIILPNVKEGSVIEYSCIIKSPFIQNFPDWYFQYDIPANNVSYTTNIPGNFVYNRVLNPYLPITQRSAPNMSDTSSAQGSSFGINSNTYSVKNVPALKDEYYVDNIANYISFVKHELAAIKYINHPTEHRAMDWPGVVKDIYEDKDFGHELSQKNYFEKDLDPILATVTGRDDRIAAVFNFVKNRMAWNSEIGYYCSKGVKKAYAEKTGSDADINLMLTAMLRYAGLGANPVLLSTRKNGLAMFVSKSAFNYVIAGVEVPDDIIYLDATSKNTAPGLLPIRALNVVGRIIRDNESSAETDLRPKHSSKENNVVFATLNPGGDIVAKVRRQYYDYNAYLFREAYSAGGHAAQLEKEFKGSEVSGNKVAPGDDTSKPVTEDFSLDYKAYCLVAGNNMYISPMLFFTSEESPFNQEKRTYPIDFVYPSQTKYAFHITIPPGYTVESLPAPISITMQEGIGSFSFNIAKVSEGQLQVNVQQDFNYARVNPEYYVTLKDFFKKMIEKQNEKIVLKKA